MEYMKALQGKIGAGRLIEIQISKGCILVLTDVELMRELPPELLARGLKRGKAIRRRRVFDDRERQKGQVGPE